MWPQEERFPIILPSAQRWYEEPSIGNSLLHQQWSQQISPCLSKVSGPYYMELPFISSESEMLHSVCGGKWSICSTWCHRRSRCPVQTTLQEAAVLEWEMRPSRLMGCLYTPPGPSPRRQHVCYNPASQVELPVVVADEAELFTFL